MTNIKSTAKKSVDLPLDLEILVTEKQLSTMKQGKKISFSEIVTDALRKYFEKK